MNKKLCKLKKIPQIIGFAALMLPVASYARTPQAENFIHQFATLVVLSSNMAAPPDSVKGSDGRSISFRLMAVAHGEKNRIILESRDNLTESHCKAITAELDGAVVYDDASKVKYYQVVTNAGPSSSVFSFSCAPAADSAAYQFRLVLL